MDDSILTTDAGTRVYKPSAEEFAEHLETRAQVLLGMSVSEFKRVHDAGEVDDADPAVSELVALLHAFRLQRTPGDP